MKRTIERKLVLIKETIADLSDTQLNSVKGGTIVRTAASCMEPPESRCICERPTNDCVITN
jgi:hypothetical protein